MMGGGFTTRARIARLPGVEHTFPFLVGFSESVDLVMLISACVMVLGIVLAVLLPELPLRTVSGIQGRLDADAAAAAEAAPGATPGPVPDAVVPGDGPAR